MIRPLVYCAEEDIRAFAEAMAFPILPCDLCGSQEQLQRKQVAQLLDGFERERPGTKASMLAALQNVHPTHLLDRDLWRTLGIHAAPHEHSTRGVLRETRLVRS